ncbi:hypothetical protein [Hyalangium rubrum]|uniref:TonB C-terminal domain-containing protein n=1 Tax=Hyalangium rubrum TaxID=3103134 RepID=A0ABU5GZG9_9BACT|nr:hypothetical protein [Hyalangium sp. s54d21]MDY7226579.1 hypothetical protein [Hyalangium sp. s54d21]
MNPRELRKAMRQRRSELRKSLRLAGKQARERMEQLPEIRRARARRRLRRALGVALLVLLASFVRCECEQPAPAEVPKVEAKGEVEIKEERPAQPPPRRQPLLARVEPHDRASYQGPERASPDWIDEFRLQVAARSPRLAQCFAGSDRPGSLRWTASVNPRSGAVSDHELEPVGAGAGLRREQHECVVRALSSPPYKLTAPQGEALPQRVSLVIEF